MVVGNLKMYWNTAEEAETYANDWQSLWSGSEGSDDSCRLVLCPPAVFTDRLRLRLPEGIALGAQDVSWEPAGAYTGEVSSALLAAVGAEYVIVGHSERRRLHGETDETVGRKTSAAVRDGLRAIVCIGETEEERRAGKAVTRVREQLSGILPGIPRDMAERIIIAYEPLWAIGTDTTPTAGDVHEMEQAIRTLLEESFGLAAESVPVLYGGSVDADNARELCIGSGMDGALVGRQSLAPRELLAIYRACRP